MRTTGGALAFDDLVPPYEATLTKNLRDAGAIIIAKTGMTELANWVAGAPMPMPATTTRSRATASIPTIRGATRARRWPSDHADRRIELGRRHRGEFLGRQRRHRNLRLDPEPVEPEHAGGIKPTVGRISRYGVIPITADQDTPGPMAKYVSDIAIMFGVLESGGPRSERPGDQTCTPPPGHDYTKSSGPTVSRARASDSASLVLRPRDAAGNGAPPGWPEHPSRPKSTTDAIAVLKQQGATVIFDPV